MNIIEPYKRYMQDVFNNYMKLVDEGQISHEQASYLYNSNEQKQSYLNVAEEDGLIEQLEDMKAFDKTMIGILEIGAFHAD